MEDRRTGGRVLHRSLARIPRDYIKNYSLYIYRGVCSRFSHYLYLGPPDPCRTVLRVLRSSSPPEHPHLLILTVHNAHPSNPRTASGPDRPCAQPRGLCHAGVLRGHGSASPRRASARRGRAARDSAARLWGGARLGVSRRAVPCYSSPARATRHVK